MTNEPPHGMRYKPIEMISMEKARKLGDDHSPDIGVEAREYLNKNKNRYGPFATNYFDKEQAKKFIEALYSAGAKKVIVTRILAEKERIRDEGDVYADTLCVINPTKDALIEVAKMRPEEIEKQGDHIRLWWD